LEIIIKDAERDPRRITDHLTIQSTSDGRTYRSSAAREIS
jgi:hypothetical protein